MMRIVLVGAVALAAAAFSAPAAVADGSSAAVIQQPRPPDQLPCLIPCAGFRYEAVVDAATGIPVAVSPYDPQHPDQGRLFAGNGQVIVDVTSNNVVDLMQNMAYYTINIQTGEAVEHSSLVDPYGVPTSATQAPASSS